MRTTLTVCPETDQPNPCQTSPVLRLLISGGLAALALSPAVTVTPPPAPGPWQQAGAALSTVAGKTATSRGTRLSFYRTLSPNPTQLAVVVRSTSTRLIHLFWWSYCVITDDDTLDETHQGTMNAVGSVIVYPPVLQGATLCFVSANVTLPGKGRAAAAIFSSTTP